MTSKQYCSSLHEAVRSLIVFGSELPMHRTYFAAIPRDMRYIIADRDAPQLGPQQSPWVLKLLNTRSPDHYVDFQALLQLYDSLRDYWHICHTFQTSHVTGDILAMGLYYPNGASTGYALFTFSPRGAAVLHVRTNIIWHGQYAIANGAAYNLETLRPGPLPRGWRYKDQDHGYVLPCGLIRHTTSKYITLYNPVSGARRFVLRECIPESEWDLASNSYMHMDDNGAMYNTLMNLRQYGNPPRSCANIGYRC